MCVAKGGLGVAGGGVRREREGEGLAPWRGHRGGRDKVFSSSPWARREGEDWRKVRPAGIDDSAGGHGHLGGGGGGAPISWMD